MYSHSAIALLLAVGLRLDCSGSHSATSSRKSNANDTVFKYLLGLYKINPLKSSQVFQSFSKDVLLGMGRGKDRVVLNNVSSESVIVNKRVKTNLNEIEKIIHTRNKKPANNFEKPAYDLGDDVSTENFKAEVFINDQVVSKEEFQRTILNNHNMIGDVSYLLDDIESNEADNETPVTKLLPVKNNIDLYSQWTNKNKTVLKFADDKGKSDNHYGTLPEIPDRNPEDIRYNTLNNFLEGNIIVF